jgi:L-alanine-DL-glutamate epimerase-like enolase superfamily enzyme
MKITAIETSVIRVPNAPPMSTFYATCVYVVVRIKTDQGLEGLGYTMLMGGAGVSAVRSYIQDNLVPLMIGEDPQAIGRLWQKMYENDRGIRKKGIPVYAISAIDIGLWDLLGKSVGKPLWQLLGSYTDHAPVYGSGGFMSYTVDELIKEAEGFRAHGVKHYKMKIGHQNIMKDVERVGALRKALGDDMGIMVDANQRWDVPTNIKVANRIAQYDIYWYEEPVLADNIGQCATVARSIPIPVATGENEYTRYGFRDLIDQKAAHFLNPDIQRCGGFSEALKIAHLAAAHDLPIAPHLVPELSIHLLVSIPNASFVEWLAGSPADLWVHPLEFHNGTLSPPLRPGHGMEFNPEIVKRFSD